MATLRLQKIIAQAGICSRRRAEQLIVEGRVWVNGQRVMLLGTKAHSQHDRIEIDGHGQLLQEPLVYIAMYKPRFVVSTVADPEGRSTVLNILRQSRAMGGKSYGARTYEGELPRVYPVGRLDFDAEGLILLTNDGALTQQLLHPRHHVPKTYMVRVRGVPLERDLEQLRRGVRLAEVAGHAAAFTTAPADVKAVKQGRTNTWLEMTLFEGRYHQVKRMCEAVDHTVVRLIRTEFGGVLLDDMPVGAWRFLSPAEVQTLKVWHNGAQQSATKHAKDHPGNALPRRRLSKPLSYASANESF